MRQLIRALALSTFCLAVSSCSLFEKRVQVPVPIPEDRMDCVTLTDQRPTVAAEYVIDWSGVTTVAQARAEHEAFVTRLRERENLVALYIVEVEGELWACADDDEWLRDYVRRLPSPETGH